MHITTVRQLLLPMVEEYLQEITVPSGEPDGYECPICGGDGMQVIKRKAWECTCCGRRGNIFALIGHVEGIKTYSQQVARACDLFELPFDVEWHNLD